MFIILCLLRALPLWMRAYLAEGERDVFLCLRMAKMRLDTNSLALLA